MNYSNTQDTDDKKLEILGKLLNLQAIHGAGDLYKLLEGSGDLILTITRDMRTFTRTVRPELPQA